MTVQEAIQKSTCGGTTTPTVLLWLIDVALAADEYVRERENPAPDYTMRKIRFDHLKKKLEEATTL